MAVGRRKRFATGTLPTVSGTLMTAGSAPSDGSAAATVWIRLVNASNASAVRAVTIGVAGGSVFQANLPPSSATDINQQGCLTLGPFDLMGGETVTGVASAADVAYNITGVEAKDS